MKNQLITLDRLVWLGGWQDGAAVCLCFFGDSQRFPNARAARGWSGLVPRSSQSAGREAKGLHISQAGPDLVKIS